MDFVKIDSNMLLLSVNLKECGVCGRKMTSWVENDLLVEWRLTRRSIGIVKESYSELGICTSCIKKADFLVNA